MVQKKEKKISALQMSSVIGNPEKNRGKAEEIISRELDKGTDFLILPEVWTVGWSCEDFPAAAEDSRNSQTVKFLSDIAKRYSVNILGGSYIERKSDGRLYNTCPVISRSGELIAEYSKMHLYTYCGCTEGNYITEGEHPVMVNIEGINIGLTICYDIRFPEIFRAYRSENVDLLVNMAAWGLKKPIPWETLTRARAIENQAFMIAVTQSGKIKDNDWNIGHSRIFDYVGETITEIKNQQEGLMTCKIKFDKMYEYRNSCTILKDIHEKYEVRVI